MSKTQIGGYPDPQASREEKQEDIYGIEYFKRMYGEWSNEESGDVTHSSRSERYRKCRDYSSGMQSIEPYKELMGATGDSSFLSLNWEVVPVIPKFVDVIVGGLTNQDYKIKCTSIDKVSQDKRSKDKLELLTKMHSKQFMEEVTELSGLPLNAGFDDLPEDKDELELYMQLKYKQAIEIAMEEGIELTFYLNDWEEIKKGVIRDIIDINFGGTKTSVEDGQLRIRRVDPANLITSHSTRPDFKNIQHAGEITYMTIHELKKLAGDAFTTDEYDEIGRNNLGVFGNSKSVGNNTGNNQNDSGLYDSFKIAVLDGVFKSTDALHYEKKHNKFGGHSINKKSTGYKAPKKSKYKREQIKTHIENIYKGSWIVGTDSIFGYGLATNILRPKSNLSRAILPYSLYSPNMRNMNSKGLVERMMPFADQIQLCHLKIQHLMSKAKPKGSAIELGAIENVGKGDGGTFTPIEVQDIYQQTGNLYYRAQADEGSPTQVNPIQELGGGIGGALQEIIAIYQYNMQMIRDVTGINEVRDASQPDKESLVGVNKMALLASNNATRWINQAVLSITQGTATSIALRVSDLVKYKGTYKGYVRAIGEFNMKAIEVSKDVTMADYGIMIEPLPDEEERALLESNIQMSIQQGALRLEDAIIVRGIRNTKLANQMLILRRKKYATEQNETAQANAQANAQQQQQSIQAKSQSDSQLKQMDAQIGMQKLQAEYEMKERFAQAEHERTLKELEYSGSIKTDHIELSQDDSDLVRNSVK
tara:strand:+ start:2686 stop:4968 length:2283 start_codon:yes stop_codon:yes gene_type:complete